MGGGEESELTCEGSRVWDYCRREWYTPCIACFCIGLSDNLIPAVRFVLGKNGAKQCE